MAKQHGVVTKIVKGYSLSMANIEWVAMRALASSTPAKKVSDSAFLDGVLTGLREKQERAEEAFAEAHRKTGLRTAERRTGVAG
jgi:hypothetical protein